MRKTIVVALLFVVSSCAPASSESFKALDETAWSYEQMLQSSKSIFFIWTTWCPYCREELERLAQQCNYAQGVEIFFINAGEDKTQVDRYARAQNFKDCIRKRIILDRDSFIADKFLVVGVPTFLFFQDGNLIHRSYYLDQKLLESVY